MAFAIFSGSFQKNRMRTIATTQRTMPYTVPSAGLGKTDVTYPLRVFEPPCGSRFMKAVWVRLYSQVGMNETARRFPKMYPRHWTAARVNAPVVDEPGSLSTLKYTGMNAGQCHNPQIRPRIRLALLAVYRSWSLGKA